MSKILRVNLANLQGVFEDVPEKYAMLGGRGLTSQIVLDEVNPTCHPLGEHNKLVIAPGLFAGTRVPSSGRISIGAKSPLTGGIKESNAGGTVARKLAKLGIKAIILEGKPTDRSWYILKIGNNQAALEPAQDLVGLGNFATMDRLRKVYGSKVGIMSIGQAGEMQLSAASVAVSDMQGLPCRHCGRGGLGAVMGSKGIKAIVIDDSEADERLLEIADVDGFNEIAKSWAMSLAESKKGLTNFGTASLVDPISAVGGLPTRNFSAGNFEGAEKINGRTLAETINARGGKVGHGCSPGCVIRCSNIYHDSEGNYVVSALEYETIVLMGSNLGIDSLDIIAGLNRKCNDYGLDTMEVGVAIGVAMEAGIAEFGDGKAALNLVDEIGRETVLGRMLGQGAAVTGRVLGVTRVPSVKGQAMSAYDPRALKGTGVTYATSPMGADHTAGNCLPGRGGVDPNLPEGQIKVSRDLQIMSTVVDAMGLCLFVGPLPDSMEVIAQLLARATGKTVSVEDVLEIGKRILKCELEFNRQAGFTKAHDRLPEFFKVEKLKPKDLVFDISDTEIDEVFNF